MACISETTIDKVRPGQPVGYEYDEVNRRVLWGTKLDTTENPEYNLVTESGKLIKLPDDELVITSYGYSR